MSSKLSKPRRLRCEEGTRPLLPLERHAYRLFRMLNLVEGSVPAARAADWLILAAGLTSVSIETDGLDNQDLYCPNEFEEDRGRGVSAVATELTRMLFLWGALDGLMRVILPPRAKGDEGNPKRMCRLVDAGTPEMLHHRCACRNLLEVLAQHGTPELSEAATTAQQFDTGYIGQGTLAACNVRNSLAHGGMPWPSDSGPSSAHGVFIGQLSSRMLLFAIQRLMIQMNPTDSVVTIWPEPESEAEITEVPVVTFLPDLHLRDSAYVE